jgi:hypothetical protein
MQSYTPPLERDLVGLIQAEIFAVDQQRIHKKISTQNVRVRE